MPHSINESGLDETADLHAQVSSLVSLRLLDRVSTPDNIDAIRLRVSPHSLLTRTHAAQCLASLADVKRVADSIGFELFRYLHDAEAL